MSYLVRFALENSETLDQALAVFRDRPRTCEYYYVVSDGKIPSARGLHCTPEKMDVVEPGKAHPLLAYPVADTVLLSAGDRYKRLVMRTQAHYGSFGGPEALALMRRPVAMSGCLHAVLFRPTDGRFWVSDAAPDQTPASELPYAQYELTRLMAEGLPTTGGE